MIVEGSKVAYAGDTDPFQEVGSLGKVIALSGDAAHVQWLSGPKSGSIELIQQYELVPDRSQQQGQQGQQDQQRALVGSLMNSFDNALDMPASETISVRATYDDLGEEGLVNALSEAGHLAMLSEYVDDAVGYLAARVRQDPGLGDILAQLEADEADGLVGRVASLLLSDRLNEED